MYYLIGFGIGLLLSVLVIIPGMDEFGVITLHQLKKSYSKLVPNVLVRIFTK
mgnify:FL=1